MKSNINKITKNFLLGEAIQKVPSVSAYLHSLEEIVSSLTPRTVSDSRKLEIAKQHIKEVRRQHKRIQEQMATLEEQVRVLEENKE